MTDRLLMLCPYWPPMGGPGVQRGVKFAKYLPKHGVSPFVVTRTVDAEEDASLLADAAATPVRYARHIPFQRLGKGGEAKPAPAAPRRVAAFKQARDWLQLPDHVISWVPFAVSAGSRWAREVQPTALFSTSPYHSTHLAGLRLKQKWNLPWIAEFRDPWAADLFTSYPTAFHRKANAALEARVVNAADAVVVISEGMRRDFQTRYPRLKRIEVIYNGFDTADFSGDFTAPPRGEPWVIRHLGTFYPDRKPDAFLRGLAFFLQRRPAARHALKVELYGRHHSDVEARLRALTSELGLDDTVQFFPYVAHREAVTLLRTSHALLLVPGPGETTVTGKLFEYLAAARPILATAPYPSGIDEVFSKLGNSPLRVDDTPEAVVPALEKLYAALSDGDVTPLLPPPARVVAFTREGAAAQLADLVRELRRSPVRL